MNKKTNKILSLVLAFVMVLAAIVPAFADTTGTPEKPKNNDKKIVALVTKGNLKQERVNVSFNSDVVETNKEGEATYAPTGGLSKSRQYNVTLGANLKDQVVEGTAFKYVVNTDVDGKISKVVAISFDKDQDKNVEKVVKANEIEFKLKNVAPTPAFFTVNIRKQNGELLKDTKEVKVFELKTKNNQYLLSSDLVNQVNKTKELAKFDVTGTKGFTKDDVSGWKTEPFLQVDLPIVAFVIENAGVDGEDVVAFANPQLDKVVNLTIPTKDTKLTVVVSTCALPAKAIEGAKVEIVANETVLWGPEKYGKTVATATTDKYGQAVFTNAETSKLLEYLLPNFDKTNNPVFGETVLPYKVVVTSAKGYKVPAEAKLTVQQVLATETSEYLNICLKNEGSDIVGRIAGETRYDTAVELANRIPQADRSDTVILANGNNFADALVGNGLTRREVKDKKTPILLTNGTALTKATEEYLKDNKIKKVIILGGENSVSPALQAKLDAEGRKTARVFGEDRYATSVAIMERIARLSGVKEYRDVFVANGSNMADALVASVPAARYGRPILLVAKDNVPSVVSKALFDYKVKEAIVVGGPNSVSATAVAGLNVSNIQRLYGANRQLTSMVLAKKYFPQAGSAFVASATTPVDALVGGLVAANKEAPILLTDGNKLTKEVGDYIRTHKITDVTVIGGPSTVSESVRVALENVILGK